MPLIPDGVEVSTPRSSAKVVARPDEKTNSGTPWSKVTEWMSPSSNRPEWRSFAALDQVEHEKYCATGVGLQDLCTCGALFRSLAGFP